MLHWAKVTPPAALIAATPSAPSPSSPDSTTPSARLPALLPTTQRTHQQAYIFHESFREAQVVALLKVIFLLGGMTYTWFGSTIMPACT